MTDMIEERSALILSTVSNVDGGLKVNKLD